VRQIVVFTNVTYLKTITYFLKYFTRSSQEKRLCGLAQTQEEQGYIRKYDGSGLGLSLVQKYAKINKTNLTFTSTKEVQTTLRLDLIKIVK
jgi:light-regulated signal transduction histidine kinase (bacteriophytochrome)